MNTPTSDPPAYLSYPALGLDISKLTFDARLLMPAGASFSKQFANTPAGFKALDHWLAQHQAAPAYAAMEATGTYGKALLWHLRLGGHTVCLLNPRHVKNFARSKGRRVKTDATDASLIAEFILSHQPRPWNAPTQGSAQLQALVRRRQQLVAMLGAESNRLEQSPACTASSIRTLMAALRQHLASINTLIEKLLLEDSRLQKAERLLRSIPGVGRQVAVTFLGEVPTLETFARARDLATFAGLTPALQQSGTSVYRRGAMSKEGSALLRKMLYMAALNIVRRPTLALHSTYAAMVARGKAKACALGALMHKILRIAFGVLKHETPYADSLARL